MRQDRVDRWLGPILLLLALLWSWMVADTIPVVTAILAALVALFAVYALRTACRQLTRMEIDENGVSARGPVGHTVSWQSIKRVKLAYYSTRRDRTERQAVQVAQQLEFRLLLLARHVASRRSEGQGVARVDPDVDPVVLGSQVGLARGCVDRGSGCRLRGDDAFGADDDERCNQGDGGRDTDPAGPPGCRGSAGHRARR